MILREQRQRQIRLGGRISLIERTMRAERT
jgi:hypothetical protein